MKPKSADNLVDNLATMAAKSKNIKSFVIAYSDRAGNVTYHRDGRFAEQLGLVTMLKERMVGDFNDYHSFVGDDDE